MSNIFSDWTEEQRQRAVAQGLSIMGCDGMTALWLCRCGKILCTEYGTPYGSPRCVQARDEGRCRHNPTPRGPA